MHGLLLTSSQDELVHDSVDAATAVQQFAGSSHWETLELYLVRIFYALLSFCQCVLYGLQSIILVYLQMSKMIYVIRFF